MVRRTIAGVLAASLLLALSAGDRGAHAATINVACDTTALIQAIEAANNEGTNPGPDTLELASGCSYVLTSAYGGGANGLPNITSNITVNGNGAIIGRSGLAPRFRILQVNPGGALTLNRVLLTGGRAPHGVLPGGTGESGGGFYMVGNLNIVDSIITDNETGDGFDGDSGFGAGGQSGSGGGIYQAAGTLNILGSTIEGNATGPGGDYAGGGGGSAGFGGGIFVNAGTATITNSTFTANSTGSGGNGGTSGGSGGSGSAIARTHGDVSLTNVTISGNSAGAAGSGGVGIMGRGALYTQSNSPGLMKSNNSIVASNAGFVQCDGPFSAGTTYNLATDSSCGGFAPTTPAAINLGSLADNGGPTPTIAVNYPSVAIDQGNSIICEAAPVNNVDQRGAIRPIDGDNSGLPGCDIGAYEAPGLQTGPTFIVNSTAPDNDGACHTGPDCTLREAITAANADGVPSTVVLGNAQTYTLTVADNANNGLPVISTPITVNGNGSTIARDPAAARFRIFDVGATASLALDHMTVTGGSPPNKTALSDADGAGIQVNSASLTLNAVTVSGNTSGNGRAASTGTVGGHGGGIYLAGSATAEVADSTISGNTAGRGGSGNTGNGGAGGSGGGIYVTGTASLLLSRSAVNGNNAGDGGSTSVGTGGTGGGGGGIFVNSTASASITNSTITQNTAGDGGDTDGSPTGVRGSGGGLRSLSGSVYLANDTIAGNARGSIGGTAGTGGNISTTVAIAAANTLVANPAVGENCAAATFTGSTNNMASDATCGVSFLTRTSGQINLGTLANNGGATQTMALILPSSAIDAGDNTTCAAGLVNNMDQRGVTRPIDGDGNASAACDIGAFETPGLQSGPTLVVNSTDDDNDGACHLLPGDCTLREAVVAANANPDATTINFNVSPAGMKTIVLFSSVDLTQPATIDGGTQPGFAGTPIIEVKGFSYISYPDTALIKMLSNDSLVKGLAINSSKQYGISIGDFLSAGSATGNRIEGNFIGTDVTGTISRPNLGGGVLLHSSGANNIVGGTATAARNVISGNGGAGIGLVANQSYIQNNLIGTTVSGSTGLGNAAAGIVVLGDDNVIGGTGADEGNTIAFNGAEGVRVDTLTGNTIRGNSIFANGGLGIDNVNGGNGEPGQAPPVITGAGSAAGTSTCPDCAIDVYSDTADEGRIYHGSTVADGAGFWLFPGPVIGPNVTVTATNAGGSTTEFSNALPCTDGDDDDICTSWDNCPVMANPNQEDFDLDGMGDECDPEDDGDGYTDLAESGQPLCNGLNDDAFDDAVVDDGCPSGPVQAGSYSEAQFKIGTGSMDPCGGTGWPSDLWDIGPSANKLDVQDVLSFVAPTRLLDKSPGLTSPYNPRWDLAPGPNTPFPAFINIVDVTTLITGTAGSPAFPPMLNGLRAFGRTCPVAP